MKIGASIKQARKAKKLTQTALAEKIGISITSVSNIESGRYEPSKKTMAAICSALGTHPAMLYLLAIERDDVAEGKRDVFDAIQPMLRSITIEVMQTK